MLLWLEIPFFALVLLVLSGWTFWGKRRINWNGRLTENGEMVDGPTQSEKLIRSRQGLS